MISTIPFCHTQKDISKSEATENNRRLGKAVSEMNETIWFIYQDKKSNYWFSSKEKGVFCYDGKELIHYTKEDGLVSNQIREIQEDSIGNLFFETTIGVSKFDGKSFSTLAVKSEKHNSNHWRLKPSDLWFRIGFNKRGPYRYDGEALYYLEFPKSPQEDEFNKKGVVNYSPYGIYSIYKDREGVMWFGTTSLGLCRFDGQSFGWYYEEQLQTTPNGGDFGSRAIFEDKEGFFWLNNTRFRYKFKSQNNNKIDFEKENGIGHLNVSGKVAYPFFLSITQDNEGDLWMVTYADGVWRNNGKELIHYPVKDGDSEVLLFSIFKDNKGLLWLGTFDKGVYKFNGETFEKFKI